ncbi:HNH endonuclease [bacterium]|nr:HNH endonuclease [bacterium]
MKKENRQAYIRFKKYATSEILPIIGKKERHELEPGVFVKTYSVRLQTFKRSLECVECGIKGLHFWAEKQEGQINNHLNLYGIDKHGDEILMTKDHIIPKSKGGSESLKNMQTMCTRCNGKKGNNLE